MPSTTHKLIKSLGPLKTMEILTNGVCVDILEKDKEEMMHFYRDVDTWPYNSKVDLLSFYVSDTGFKAFVSKDRAEELKNIFKSWNIFYEVYSNWYGGDTYYVGFNFTYDAFDKLYVLYQRNNKLDTIVASNHHP